MPPRPAHKEQASSALARVAPQVSRWVERLLAAHEPPLSLAQYLALEELDRGEVRATDIARAAGVTRSAVSQLLASLEASGLLLRGGPSDRRGQELRLSPDGTRVLRSARTVLRRRLDAVLGELPPPESDALARGLSRVEQILAGAAPPRRPPKPPGPRRPPPKPPGRSPRRPPKPPAPRR